MMNPHTTEPFAPVIFGLTILVSTPALALLVPNELVATFTATPLRRAVSAVVVLAIGGTVSLWAVSRVSFRVASAAEAPRAQEAQGGDD